MDRSIEAIAATCGLIHDLGNPNIRLVMPARTL